MRQLGERGYAGMSIEIVAAAAGTSPPSLRRRYPDKLALALAGLDAMPVTPLPRSAVTPRADALAVLENLWDTMVRRNGLAVLAAILAERDRHPQLVVRFRQHVAEPREDRLRAALVRGVLSGSLPAVDPGLAVSLLTGSLYAGTCAASGSAATGPSASSASSGRAGVARRRAAGCGAAPGSGCVPQPAEHGGHDAAAAREEQHQPRVERAQQAARRGHPSEAAPNSTPEYMANTRPAMAAGHPVVEEAAGRHHLHAVSDAADPVGGRGLPQRDRAVPPATPRARDRPPGERGQTRRRRRRRPPASVPASMPAVHAATSSEYPVGPAPSTLSAKATSATLAMFANATMTPTTSTSRPASASARRNRRPALSCAASPRPAAAAVRVGAAASGSGPARPRRGAYMTATPASARPVPPAAVSTPASSGPTVKPPQVAACR